MKNTKQTKLKKLCNDCLVESRSANFFAMHVFLSLAIVVSVSALVLDSVEALSEYDSLFFAVELITSGIFTIEYFARIYTAKSRLKYIFSYWGLIDILSILPTYLHLAEIMPLESARVLRILRAIRAVRLAKLAQRNRSFKNRRHEVRQLNFASYFFAMFSSIIILGTLMYLFEGNTTENYRDIPAAMYQTSKLLLGIDFIQPVTAGGQAIMLLGGFVGLALLGLLITVIGPVLSRLLLGSRSK